MKFLDALKGKKYIFSLENLFLVMALLFGSVIAFMCTPFQECDGWEHFLRAVDVSYGNLFSPVATINHGSGQIIVPEDIDEVSFRLVEPASGEGTAYSDYLKANKPSKNSRGMTFNGGVMSPFYYPQALGFLLGRILGVSWFACVALGRLFNLIAYAILAYLAIKITPVLKNTMITIALFPMTVYQAASFSPDALLNGLCFLFIALCFYYAYGKKEELGIKEPLTLGCILALIFLCKYVYVFLGLLVFIIPKKKFGDNKQYFKKFMIALILILILGIIAVKTATAVISSGSAAAVADTAQVKATMSPLQFLTSNPLNIFKVLFYTFCYKFSDYLLWLDTLGSLNYPLGPLIYIVPMFTLYVLGSECMSAENEIRLRDKFIALFAFAMVAVAVVLGIYIGDTRINFAGNYIVQGVQGRYFIAALPACALFFAPRGRTGKKWYSDYLLLLGDFFILCLAIYFLNGNCQ